jgi:hypothetical protein
MRRILTIALVIALGLGPLAACGKKAVPKLREGDTLKIEKGKERDIGVAPPEELEEEGADTEDSQGAPMEGVPPSPGGPEEGGF